MQLDPSICYHFDAKISGHVTVVGPMRQSGAAHFGDGVTEVAWSSSDQTRVSMEVSNDR